MNSNKLNLINKIRYRSQYRGTKEMDIYVSTFVDNIINDLDFDELEHLNKLVSLNDEQIIDISKGLLKFDINKKILNLLNKFNNK
jgi:antitoxin CptB